MAATTAEAKAPTKRAGGMKKSGTTSAKPAGSGPAFDVPAEDAAASSSSSSSGAEATPAAEPSPTSASTPAAGAGAPGTAPPKKKLSALFSKDREGKVAAPAPDVTTFCSTFHASIPDKRRADFKEWKVIQAAITKPAEGAGKAGRVNAKLSRMSTSKIHKFKPFVTLEGAVEWLAGFGHADSSLVFENQCMLVIEKGVFKEFEDLREAPGAAAAGDDEEESTEAKAPPADDSDSGGED